MSDIELVIKIPENAYKATCNGWMLPTDVENVVRGIKNGKPLPEGHGRLIDADALKHQFISYGYDYGKDELDEASTIIEADRGDIDANSD